MNKKKTLSKIGRVVERKDLDRVYRVHFPGNPMKEALVLQESTGKKGMETRHG